MRAVRLVLQRSASGIERDRIIHYWLVLRAARFHPSGCPVDVVGIVARGRRLRQIGRDESDFFGYKLF